MNKLTPMGLGQLFFTVLLVGLPASNSLAYPQAGDENVMPFVNFESPHVHPLDATPDGSKLLAVNTADNRLEVFDISGQDGTPVHVVSIPVGLEPVSVRARSNNSVWVVNSISDTISVVNLNTLNVVATLETEDEPADVVFAGTPQRSFVTAAQASKVMVFDPADLSVAPVILDIAGEEPRAMAVSPDGSEVFVAIFESGNKSTILGMHGNHQIMENPNGPYAGLNPVPNDNGVFSPPVNPNLPVEPPNMGMIIQKVDGIWVDDNGTDWTFWVSGPGAGASARSEGWDVIDNDIAVIDTSTLAVSYLTGMMNIVMALDVNPNSGKPVAVGLEATNLIRFEPLLKGRFIRVNMATGDTSAPDAPAIVDLNPHLDYSDEQVAQQSNVETASQQLRENSIGDPRGIVWNASGKRAVISGMGSNNIVLVNRSGVRLGPPIPVGEGPTGLVLRGNKVYVLNKFGASVSLVSLATRTEELQVSFYDPTPLEIKVGRKHLYNTHDTSGLGHISCASCHVDARHDRVSWDLGNPAGEMAPFGENCGYGLQTITACDDFHPMKGPMLTQTLQDIIGKEPHHWRGDKTGFEGFSGAFTGLQGDDAEPSAVEMQEFEDFVATLHLPPNPFRNFDNSLPTNLPLPGHVQGERFGGEVGTPLPPGNAEAGMDVFRTRPQHVAGPGENATCVVCHTLPTGQGADMMWDKDALSFVPVAPGPDGGRHLMTTGLTMTGALRTFKVPHLRNLYKRVGFDQDQQSSRSGFGFLHDGGETLSKFFTRFPETQNNQEVANMIAFMLAFSGSDLPMGSVDNQLEPPGVDSQDSHAAVGTQLTVTVQNRNTIAVVDKLLEMMTLADTGKVGLVAKGLRRGESRGYTYIGNGEFQSDRLGEVATEFDLRSGSISGNAITLTVVPFGTETRIGIDRDLDGILDGDDPQLDANTGAIRALTLAPKLTAERRARIKMPGERRSIGH